MKKETKASNWIKKWLSKHGLRGNTIYNDRDGKKIGVFVGKYLIFNIVMLSNSLGMTFHGDLNQSSDLINDLYFDFLKYKLKNLS